MKPRVFVAIGLGLLLAAAPVLAHHSFLVKFDMNKTIVLTGVVTKMTWRNPHITFFIDVKDERGKVTNWGIEAAAPSALAARGWTEATVKSGDLITVEGFPGKDGAAFSAATAVTLVGGRKFFAGSDGAYPK
jgi:hypothetical protein